MQTEVEPDAGANALEDRVNAVLPLANKEDEEDQQQQPAPPKQEAAGN